MKKIMILLIVCVLLVGCGKQSTKKGDNKIIDATINENGDIIVDTSDISSKATFINYEIDGVTIQLMVLRATDDTIRVALNTCQSCSPSPNAYFLQDGDYLVCQNCGNKFHIDEVGYKPGIVNDGCNPIPIKIMDEEENTIIISSSDIVKYKDRFEDWNGPLK